MYSQPWNLRNLSLTPSLRRRDFLAVLATAAGGALSASAAPLESAPVTNPAKLVGFGKAKHVIYLTLSGGLSQMDSFDPKPQAPEKARGETRAISTNVPGTQVGEWFPKMARQLDQWCLVRSRISQIGAHDKGLYFIRTGYAQMGADTHPHLGAWMSMMIKPPRKTDLPSNFLINAPSGHPRNGWMAPEHAPLPLGNAASGLPFSKLHPGIHDARLLKRLDLAKVLGARFRAQHLHQEVQVIAPLYENAADMMRSADLVAFDLAREPENVREDYGQNAVGQGLLLARRLVERGVQHVEVHGDGWDHHVQIYEPQYFPERSREVDDGLSALVRDLSASGLLAETLIVVTTEFGRTPEISDVLGRNHWPQAFTCLLAGAGIKAGAVYGATDAAGREITEDAIETEDWCATIAHLAGLPWHIDTFSPSRRPFRPGGKAGKARLELLG